MSFFGNLFGKAPGGSAPGGSAPGIQIEPLQQAFKASAASQTSQQVLRDIKLLDIYTQLISQHPQQSVVDFAATDLKPTVKSLYTNLGKLAGEFPSSEKIFMDLANKIISHGTELRIVWTKRNKNFKAAGVSPVEKLPVSDLQLRLNLLTGKPADYDPSAPVEPGALQARLDELKAMGKNPGGQGGRRKTRKFRIHKKSRSKRQNKKTRR